VLSRSGLTAAQLLAPFARADPGLTVQTSGEPYRLRRFCMRFEAAGDIRAASPEESERRLLTLVAAHDTSQPLQEQRTAALAPWLAPVHEALSAELRYAEHAGTSTLSPASSSAPPLSRSSRPPSTSCTAPACRAASARGCATRRSRGGSCCSTTWPTARATPPARSRRSASSPAAQPLPEPSRNLLGTFSEPSRSLPAGAARARPRARPGRLPHAARQLGTRPVADAARRVGLGPRTAGRACRRSADERV